jgi:hybrid polyketide synthase/nonribosomal peptide synthetase ACE1
VIHRLEDISREHSSRIAIRHRIEDTLTFGDMRDRVNRIYEALSEAAVAVGSAVGVHMSASADWICSLLAIIKYGSIYVPLDLRQGKTRLTAIVKKCQPAAIIVDGQTFGPAEELISIGKIKRINLSNIVGSAKIPTRIRTLASDQAAFYYTSGSTGIPKGIPLTNEGICVHMEGMSERLKVSPDDVMLQQTAFSFDFSLWQILIALTNGASIVIVPDHLRRDAVSIVDLMVKSNITMTATTPSEYSSWLRYGASKLRDSAWTRILCGGEPMPHGFLEDLWGLGKVDLRLEHLYGEFLDKPRCALQIPRTDPHVGPTEITFIATTCPLDYSKEYTVIPIGRPIANYTIVILGSDGQALPVGVLGEIAIGSVCVSARYLNKPEESHQKFRSRIPALDKIGVPPVRFHMTGDEGWLSSEGLLYISGRIAGDTQMKLRYALPNRLLFSCSYPNIFLV